MPALGQKLGYLYCKAETKTRKYTDWQTSQTFPHLGDKKTKRDEQKDILNNIGIGTGSPSVSNRVRLIPVLDPGSRSNMVMMNIMIK